MTHMRGLSVVQPAAQQTAPNFLVRAANSHAACRERREAKKHISRTSCIHTGTHIPIYLQ